MQTIAGIEPLITRTCRKCIKEHELMSPPPRVCINLRNYILTSITFSVRFTEIGEQKTTQYGTGKKTWGRGQDTRKMQQES